jgi:ArsR family transcriptional regulator
MEGEKLYMAEIFKILSDETRIRIIALLLNDEMCVCEIEKALELTQSNASRHLTILKKSNILANYKKAQWNYYKINKTFISGNLKLWEYFKEEIKKLPIYETDYKNFKKCRSSDLCNKIIK